MTMIYVVLGNGFEEMEAIVPVDLMRRAGLEVKTAGIGRRQVTGGHGIPVTADCVLEDVQPGDVDLLMLPGGMGGVESILASEAALALIRAAAEADKYVAAICAAPMVLGKLGLLQGRRATIYPGMEAELLGATPVPGAKAVVDGRIVTGQGPGAAFDFGLCLVELLLGEQAAQKVRNEVHYGA